MEKTETSFEYVDGLNLLCDSWVQGRRVFNDARHRSYCACIGGQPSLWQSATICSLIALEWSALCAESRMGDIDAMREAREHRRLFQQLLTDFERSVAAVSIAHSTTEETNKQTSADRLSLAAEADAVIEREDEIREMLNEYPSLSREQAAALLDKINEEHIQYREKCRIKNKKHELDTEHGMQFIRQLDRPVTIKEISSLLAMRNIDLHPRSVWYLCRDLADEGILEPFPNKNPGSTGFRYSVHLVVPRKRESGLIDELQCDDKKEYVDVVPHHLREMVQFLAGKSSISAGDVVRYFKIDSVRANALLHEVGWEKAPRGHLWTPPDRHCENCNDPMPDGSSSWRRFCSDRCQKQSTKTRNSASGESPRQQHQERVLAQAVRELGLV